MPLALRTVLRTVPSDRLTVTGTGGQAHRNNPELSAHRPAFVQPGRALGRHWARVRENLTGGMRKRDICSLVAAMFLAGSVAVNFHYARTQLESKDNVKKAQVKCVV